jgi:predicted pyridoxine 5'-phosphate oxidase superfamily flavin-nucleotide-binding protein
MGTEGYHEGELAVQRRAGLLREAARLSGMLAAPDLSGGFGRFLADRAFVVITGRDAEGRLWISPLFADPGFLDAHDRLLTVRAIPCRGDPLAGLPAGQPVGLIAIEFATRRRVRVNGMLTAVSSDELRIDVDQVFGNCPKYIQQRLLRHTRTPSRASSQVQDRTTLSADDAAMITAADTLFLGTVHPSRGADASHRGGPPGFVRIDDDRLWWPDYVGNNMFTSFGNLVGRSVRSRAVHRLRHRARPALVRTCRRRMVRTRSDRGRRANRPPHVVQPGADSRRHADQSARRPSGTIAL